MPDRYVVPSGGVTSGAGGSEAPWTFAHALSLGATLAGETIFMRAGTYFGPFDSYLAGASNNYIVVRPYPGEAVKIDCDGPVSIPADSTHVWNLPGPNFPEHRGECAAGGSWPNYNRAEVDKPAICFSVQEVAHNGIDVNRYVNNSQFLGKVLLIDLNNLTSCTPCMFATEFDFIPLYHQYAASGFDILNISDELGNDGSIEQLRHWSRFRTGGPDTPRICPYHLAHMRWTHPVYTHYRVQSGTGVGGIPYMWIIDRNGVVRYRHLGYQYHSDYEPLIVSLLAEPFNSLFTCLIYQRQGAYTIYRDLEFLWSYDQRPNSPKPKSRYRPTGFGLPDAGERRPGIKLVNCVFHDLGTAVNWGSTGPEGELYGCIFYNNGWDDSPINWDGSPCQSLECPKTEGIDIEGFPKPVPFCRGVPNDLVCESGNGHDAAILNKEAVNFLVEDNIFANGYGSGLNARSLDAPLKNYVVRGNVAVNKGINSYQQLLKNQLVVAGSPTSAVVVENNYTFINLSRGSGTGYRGTQKVDNADLTFRNNVLVGGKLIASLPRYTTKLIFEGNRLHGSTASFINAGPVPAAGNVNRNEYYGIGLASKAFQMADQAAPINYLFWQSAWAALGGEVDSIFASAAPNGQWIYVRPNRYQAKRAHIIIYNWANEATVAVDIKQNLLTVGDTYEIRNAQNFYGTPVIAATVWEGGPILIPVDNLEPAELIGQPFDGAGHPETPRTRQFNVFVLTGTAPGTFAAPTYRGAIKFRGAESKGTVPTIVDAFG